MHLLIISALFHLVIPIHTAESGACQIPIIDGGSVQEEKSDMFWNWKTFRWDRMTSYSNIPPGSSVSGDKILWLNCDKPYSFDGDDTQKVQIKCLEGRWSVDPQCLAKCSTDALRSPGLLKGTKVFYRDGEVFDVACDARYRLALEKTGRIMCQGGMWTGDLSPCTPANCSDLPPSIEHGRLTDPSKMAHGSVVRYVCEDPYVLVESSLVQCAFGQWEGEPPRCQGGCQIPRIDGGSVKEEKLRDPYWNWKTFRWERAINYTTIPPGHFIPLGQLLWLTCDRPYSVHGDGEQRVRIGCLEGRWSPDPQCLRDGEKYVTSTTASPSNHFATTVESSRSTLITTIKSLLISTTPPSRAVEWTSPTNKDDENRETVLTQHSLRNSTSEECFCEYPVVDNNVVAHANGKRLVHGDKILNGSTVVFRCLHAGFHRFRGHREITCYDCQSWNSSVFPSCATPSKGDAVILFNRDINVLIDGNIEIRKGQNVTFTCIAMETANFPEWNVPVASGTSSISERRVRGDYKDVLYLTRLEIHKADYENEGIYECSVDGHHKTMIRVIITDPDLRCPELPEDDRIIIKYELERGEKSKVSFSCPKKEQELVGKPTLSCLRSGKWSDSPPYCSDSSLRCPEFPVDDTIVITYEMERREISRASFSCPQESQELIGKSVLICLRSGQWSDPAPHCSGTKCYIRDLTLPENVETDMSGVNVEFVPIGSHVGLKCRDNSIIKGKPKAMCGDHGKWILSTFHCVSGCILNIDPSSHVLVEPVKDRYQFGDFVLLSCPRGKKMSRNVERLLCLGRTWSETLPYCKESK